MILKPVSFAHITFGGISGAHPITMDISSPRANLKIHAVAGGRLFNFDYGYRADLIPTPFGVRLLINGQTIADMDEVYNELAGPIDGIVGLYDTFEAEDLQGNTWTIACGCEAVDKVISDDDDITNTNNHILPDIECYFVPITNWVKV